MEDGWFVSTRGILHFVRDNYYLCNIAVGSPPKFARVKQHENLGILKCKNCLCRLMKKVKK